MNLMMAAAAAAIAPPPIMNRLNSNNLPVLDKINCVQIFVVNFVLKRKTAVVIITPNRPRNLIKILGSII